MRRSRVEQREGTDYTLWLGRPGVGVHFRGAGAWGWFRWLTRRNERKLICVYYILDEYNL